jgi:hypothetical protein
LQKRRRESWIELTRIDVARLPVGRVHATGKAFVPFVRRDLCLSSWLIAGG